MQKTSESLSSSSVMLPGGKQAAGSNRKPYIFRVDGPSWISSADTLAFTIYSCSKKP
jgi:hypothetical protein